MHRELCVAVSLREENTVNEILVSLVGVLVLISFCLTVYVFAQLFQGRPVEPVLAWFTAIEVSYLVYASKKKDDE